MLSDGPSDQLSNRAPYSAIPWQPGSLQSGPGPGQLPSPQEGVDLAQLWGMVRDNAKLVLAIGGIVFVIVMAKCLTSTMLFRSVARMYMGESEQAAPNGSLELGTGSSEADAEIEVLRSRAMVRKGVLGSGLNVYIAPPDWEAPKYWRWLLSRRDTTLLDPTGDIVTASNTALADHVIDERYYQVSFRDSRHYTVFDGDDQHDGELSKPLQLEDATLTLLPGRIGPHAGTVLDVWIAPVDDVVATALESLTVSTPKGGTSQPRVLMLEFVSSSRRQAASFLDHLMHGYLEARLQWKTENASAAEAFVTDQLHTMRQSLDQQLARLAEYRAENGVVTTAGQAQATAQQVNRFEEQRINSQLELNALRQIQRGLKNPNLPVESYMVGEATDSVLQRMATSLNESRQKLSQLKAEYSEDAPDVQRQTEIVQAQLQAVKHYVDGRTSRAEQQLGALTHVINESEARLKTVPGAELALDQISRETEVYNRMYNNLLERKQQAAIEKASTVSKNRVLDRPYVPLYEDSPKLGLHLASGFLGLLLGAAFVLLRGLLSAVFRREHDVRGMLGPLQLIARIPTRSRVRGEDGSAAVPVFDVLGGRTDSAYVEAYRALRANLYRALPGEHGKVVMITSAEPADGKTTCALSLAAMLAADNRRVLVIDADVRKPSHHKLFGVPREPGLRTVIRDPARWRDAVRTLCLSSGSFDSLGSGDSPRAELLSDHQFASFLINTRSQYDFIILDAPSYPAVSDPLLLAPLADFVLSVVRLGSTSRRLAEEHVSGIYGVARGHGVVINNVEPAPQYIRAHTRPRLADAFRRLR